MNKELVFNLFDKYGDAYYLLDSNQFRNNYVELKDAFSKIYPHFNIAYSYKTNYTPKLCKIVNELGGYAEVVSEMELALALKIGVKPENIIWNGPIKNPKDLERFLLMGGLVNIDSFDDFLLVKQIVETYPSVNFRLGVRVNYDVHDDVISRFGFDTDSNEFTDVLSYIKDSKNTKLTSIQCHFAKRSVEYWPARAQGMIDLLDKIKIIPERIDLGGGIFGKMPDSLKQQFSYAIPEYNSYAEAAARVFFNRFTKNGPELIIEPGSALVGDCMKFVGRVKTIKCVRGKWFASVLGSQKNISMTGVNPPIEVIHYSQGKHFDSIDLVGFTCIEGDVLYRNYKGDLAVNDAIVIGNCGSYSLVMKPPFILPNFPVLEINNESIEVIKDAETFEDIFHTYNY